MNGFRRKRIKSLTLGEKIKKIRSDKRAGFVDISKNTKIQIKYLEALENEEYEKLPADVYVKGFLRTFAEYFSVDAEDLIKSFEKEKSIRDNIVGQKHKKERKEINISKFYITPKLISAILVTVLFVGLFVYLYGKMDSFIAKPELVILNPTENSVVNNSQLMVKGKTDKGSHIFINNRAVMTDDKGFFNENVALKGGVNLINIRSVNRFGKETEKTISVELK